MGSRDSAFERDALAEDVERRFHQELFEATPDQVRDAMGWRCETVGGALVSVATGASSILFNRTLALGQRQPATEDHVASICDIYADAGVARYFVHVSPHARPGKIGNWLAAQGLAPQRRWMKFERDARPAPTVTTRFQVCRIETAQGAAVGRIVADAFDLGDEAAGVFPSLVGRPDWLLFGAFVGDELAAGSGMYVQDGCAYLNFAATAPAHRCQGAQNVLLAARIEAARDRGCTLMWTETGEAVPGDPQHSYRNIERAGFSPAFPCENYAPAG